MEGGSGRAGGAVAGGFPAHLLTGEWLLGAGKAREWELLSLMTRLC